MQPETVRCPDCGKRFANDPVHLILNGVHVCRPVYGDPQYARLEWSAQDQRPVIVPLPPSRG